MVQSLNCHGVLRLLKQSYQKLTSYPRTSYLSTWEQVQTGMFGFIQCIDFPRSATFWKTIWKVCEWSHRRFWEVLETEGQAISWNFWLNGKLKKGHHIRSIFTGYSRPRQKTQFPLKQKTAQHQLSFRTNRLTSSWWEEASRNQLRQIQNQRPWWWEVL